MKVCGSPSVIPKSPRYVPNAAERAKIIALSPALAPLVNAYPIGVKPNTLDTSGVTDLTSPSGTDTAREDYAMFRIDHKFNDSTTVYIRGNRDSGHSESPADSAGALNSLDVTPENFTISLQKVFSERLLNEAKFGINRSAWTPLVIGSVPTSLSVGDSDWSHLKQQAGGGWHHVLLDR